MKNTILIFFMLMTMVIITGCSTTLNMSYDPAYIAKRNTITSNVKFDKYKSILILPYKDNRAGNKDPYKIYKNVKLGDKTLSEYLSTAIIKDLKIMGFNVVGTDDKIEFSDVKDLKDSINPNINLVLYVEVNECIPDYIMNWITVEPYSIFDLNITIWDNMQKAVVYDERLSKKIMGAETSSATFEHMVNILLNDDLSIINVDIAELLINY